MKIHLSGFDSTKLRDGTPHVPIDFFVERTVQFRAVSGELIKIVELVLWNICRIAFYFQIERLMCSLCIGTHKGHYKLVV